MLANGGWKPEFVNLHTENRESISIHHEKYLQLITENGNGMSKEDLCI